VVFVFRLGAVVGVWVVWVVWVWVVMVVWVVVVMAM
jgi:hypothetical protein